MRWTRRQMLKTTGAGALGAAFSFQVDAAEKQPSSQPDKLVSGAPVIKSADYEERVEKAQLLMTKHGMDGLLLTGGTALRYFGGFGWGRSERLFAMVIPASGLPAFVCPAFEEERARESTGEDKEVRVWNEHENPFEVLKGIFTDNGNSSARIGIEESVRFFEIHGLRSATPSFELISGDPVTIGCRAVKSTKELEIMRRANVLTVQVWKSVHDRLEAGMTENDSRAIAREEFSKRGVSGGGFVLHGPNAAYPHGTSNRIPLKKGMTVLLDGGCGLNDYRSDITRTWVFGDNPSKRQLQIWDLVKEAQTTALAAAKAGKTAGSVDDAARAVVEKGGFGPNYKYFTHRLGHGIGMDGHEWPYLVRGNELKLKPGMTFSNEPGIYIYGEIGVRLEDIMYIDEDGSARLFTEQSPSLQRPF